MTGSDLWSDGNALAGPFHDVLGVEVTAAIGGCGSCGRTTPMAEVRCSTTLLAWSLGVQPATRSCCGWSVAPAGPGWTYAALSTCSFP